MSVSRFQISTFGLITGMFVLAASLSVSVAAEVQPTPTPQVSPAQTAATDEFRPMSEAAPREVLPATPLVFIAYAFVWVALIAYVFFLWRQMARIEQDLAAVQRRVQDGSGGR